MIPSVSELGELGLGTESCLAEVVSCLVAGDIDAADWVSDCDDSSSPALIEGLVGVAVGSEVRVVIIERPVKFFGVDDAENWQFGSTRSVSELGIAAIARHPPHEAVLLLRPNGRLESQPLFIRYPLPIV